MTKYFDADGLRMAYDDVGDGEPIVLLHGFGADRRLNWKLPGWYDTLANAGYRVLALDARGHGQSAKPADIEAYRPAGIAGDAVRLLDHLGLRKACLFRYSMGGRNAAWLLAHQGRRFGAVEIGGTGLNLLAPADAPLGEDLGFGGCRGDVLVKNGGQLLLQFIGQLQFGRVTEKQPQGAHFFGGQICGLLSQGPQAAFQLLVVACGQLCFEPFQFLFAQIIQTVSVCPGNMETINHDADMLQLFPHRFAKVFVHVTTDGMDRLLQALGDRAQELDDGILLTIGQNCQDLYAAFRQPGRHNHDKVTVTFPHASLRTYLERNLIQTDNVQACILPPIHAGADPALQDTQDAVILSPDGTQVLFVMDAPDWKANRRVGHVYRIKVDLENPHRELKPGMPADGKIHLQ